MVCVINKPHEKSENHHVFEFDDILAVEYPGEKAGCKNREPCNRVKGNRSEGKSDGKSNEKKLEGNGYFKPEENKVSENAYNRCHNAAHSPEKIMGNSHEGELDALNNKDFVFAFDKTGKHHYGTGNYGNYICDYNYDVVIHFLYLRFNNKKLSG